ncbi:MAG: hypothetical protein ACJ75J_13205 [Cytophagaceae bacterium]
MKTTLIVIFIILSFHAHGQTPDDTTGIKMFNRGYEFYRKGNLDSTLLIWTEIVDKKIGIHYDIYGNAFFNIPTVYWQMKNYNKAKEWYKKILASDLRDNDETGSLMEPHTNYKHKSAMALAGLYQLDSNYSEALQWINKADTLYRYWGFEGSATNVSEEQAYMLEWKTQVLRKLNKPNEAVRAIVTELICSDRLEDFFSTSEDTLIRLIDKSSFKEKFDAAMNKLEIKKLNDSNWIALFSLSGLDYRIPISNAYPDRNIPHYWTICFINKNTTPDKQKIIGYIQERSFYKRLTN